MPLRLTGAAGSGTILKSTSSDMRRTSLCARASAVPPPKTSMNGAASIAAIAFVDDIEILLDQADARQPEMFLDFPERALRIIAQAAAPYPDTADNARSGLSPARPD